MMLFALCWAAGMAETLGWRCRRSDQRLLTSSQDRSADVRAMAAFGALSHALKDVVSPAGRLQAARALSDHVYGVPGAHVKVGSRWGPRRHCRSPPPPPNACRRRTAACAGLAPAAIPGQQEQVCGA